MKIYSHGDNIYHVPAYHSEEFKEAGILSTAFLWPPNDEDYIFYGLQEIIIKCLFYIENWGTAPLNFIHLKHGTTPCGRIIPISCLRRHNMYGYISSTYVDVSTYKFICKYLDFVSKNGTDSSICGAEQNPCMCAL